MVYVIEKYLQTKFPDPVTFQKGDIDRPPKFPDLTPVDFLYGAI